MIRNGSIGGGGWGGWYLDFDSLDKWEPLNFFFAVIIFFFFCSTIDMQ